VRYLSLLYIILFSSHFYHAAFNILLECFASVFYSIMLPVIPPEKHLTLVELIQQITLSYTLYISIACTTEIYILLHKYTA
jgi:hypothetical protein